MIAFEDTGPSPNAGWQARSPARLGGSQARRLGRLAGSGGSQSARLRDCESASLRVLVYKNLGAVRGNNMECLMCDVCKDRPVYFQGECEQVHKHKLKLCWQCTCKKSTYEEHDQWVMGLPNTRTGKWEPYANCTRCGETTYRLIHMLPICEDPEIQDKFYDTFQERCTPAEMFQQVIGSDSAATYSIKAGIMKMQKIVERQVRVRTICWELT